MRPYSSQGIEVRDFCSTLRGLLSGIYSMNGNNMYVKTLSVDISVSYE